MTMISRICSEESVHLLYDSIKDAFYQSSRKNVEDKLIMYLRNGYAIYAYFKENDVLGAVVTRKENSKTIIEAIGVEKESRGKGIGRAIINKVKQDNTTVFAETDDDAIEFYKSMGFRVKGIQRIYNNKKVMRYECEL